jgi:hypothetical protein
MRGREEGLGYWLNRRDGWKRGLFRLPRLRTTVHEASPALRTETAEAIGGLLPVPHIRVVVGSVPSPAEAGSPGLVSALPAIHAVALSGETAVVRSPSLIVRATVQELRCSIGSGQSRIDGTALLERPQRSFCPTEALLPTSIAVRSATSRARMLPHRRRSLDLSRLGAQACSTLVREAEKARGMAAGGTLIALFRNVPVQMISRMALAEEQRELIYTLAWSPERDRTHVQDLVVVREQANGQTHIVPRRPSWSSASPA